MTKTRSCGEYYKGQMRGKSTANIERIETAGTYKKTQQKVNQICENGKKFFEENVKYSEDAYYTEERALCAIEWTSYTKNMRYHQ